MYSKCILVKISNVIRMTFRNKYNQHFVISQNEHKVAIAAFQNYYRFKFFLMQALKWYMMCWYSSLFCPAKINILCWFSFLPCPHSGAGYYIATVSSFFFFFLLSSICQHVNISETLCPIMLILGHNNKSVNAHFWHDQLGVKGHVGVTGVKSPFSPKMLFLLQIKWYDHGTHIYSSARYPLQKLWV